LHLSQQAYQYRLISSDLLYYFQSKASDGPSTARVILYDNPGSE